MMPFFGTLVNFALVLAAGLLGTGIKRGIPERISGAIIQAMAVCVIYIGIDGAIAEVSQLSADTPLSAGLIKVLIMILSMGLGTLIGELVDLEKHLNRFASFVERRLSPKGAAEGTIAKGLVSCSLLFCVGAMAINGAILDAVGKPDILLAKTVIDTIVCFTMATTLGIGCALSAFVLLLYQGSITALTLLFSSFLPEASLSYVSAVGSLVIIFVGTNMLGITKARTANMVPAMFVPLLLVPLFQLIL